MKASENYREICEKLQSNIVFSISWIVKLRKLHLNTGVIVSSDDEGFSGENVCIIAIDKDLNVDTEHCDSVSEKIASVDTYPIEVQISLLEMLENGEYTIEGE